MVSVITSFSRITIIAYFSVFLLGNIILFIPNLNKIVKSIVSFFQSLMLVLFLANSTLVLYVNTGDYRLLFLFIGQLLFFSLASYFLQTVVEPISSPLLTNVCLLLSVGFVTLERLDMNRAIKHFIFSCVTLVVSVLILILLQKFSYIKDSYWAYAIFGAGMLLLVNILGSYEYGAKLSISFGSMSLQPSEFVKITFIFFIAGVCCKYNNIIGFIISSVGASIHILILALSRDFGGAFIFVMIYTLMIFVGFRNYIVLIAEGVLGVIAATYAYNHMSHIQIRFLAWRDPLSVVDDQGYQISQSLFAIGTGGWLGSGINQGMPNKIPVVAKDFIFAAISEELGAIVALELILIFVCTFLYIFKAALEINNRFYMLIATGFAVSFATQTLLNIGGVTKFIPSTGVTLPFISYGGSSLMATFLGVVIVEAIGDLSRNEQKRNHSVRR